MIEDHPHVTRSSQKALDMGLAPYVLVIPRVGDRTLNYWMDEEDLLILHATIERILKEVEE